MSESKNWASHAEFVILLITLLGGFYLLDGKIERQSQRTDRLYEMYCELRKDFDQRFYDILNERKS